MHVCLSTQTHTYTYTDVACSVQNQASPLDNDWLKFLWTDWLEKSVRQFYIETNSKKDGSV